MVLYCLWFQFFFCFEGLLEFRVDGLFYEWIFENQLLGGLVKFGLGVLDKIVFGVRVSFFLGIKVVFLRIYFFFGYFGVKGLLYLGFFLVLRFSVKDERFFGVEIDLFVYGIF